MPSEAGYQNELLAKAIVEAHLNMKVEHTGTSSHKPDLLVHLEDDQYEIDVTLAVDEWRMAQRGALFRNDEFELREIEGMPVSLWVQLGPRTKIKTLDKAAIKLAELVDRLGIESVNSYDYFRADGEPHLWNITADHQRLLHMCRRLDLLSLQRIPGSGQLIRLSTGFGGTWSGGAEEFNEWIAAYMLSDDIKDKIARSKRLASGLLGLFVWLDSSVSYGAHEWLDRGQGHPIEIDLAGSGLNEIWVASLHKPHSFVRLSEDGWHASHLGYNREPWFARHPDTET